MDYSTALGILRRLSDGVDPTTGEMFPSGSPYQQPEIIRALFTAIEVLEKRCEIAIKRDNLPVNAGKPWTEEEQTLLVNRYDKGSTVKELSKEHNRTLGAITSRLIKLGKISPTDTFSNKSNI